MEEISGFNSVFRIVLPLLCLIPGAILLVFGSMESLRWRFNISADQQLWMNILGGLMVLVGVGIIFAPLLISNRQEQEQVASPSELPPPFIMIVEPDKTLSCGSSATVCFFDISGTAGGVAPPMENYRVATFVFPQEPIGAGYYIQPRPAIMQDDGSWVQVSASFGSSDSPVVSGQQLRIVAALVESDASIDDRPINQLPDDFYLGRIEDIDGIIALSPPKDLVVVR